MKIPNIYQKELKRNLAEHGFTIHEELDNTFNLNLNEVNSREIKIRLIVSEPIIEKLHGSKNNSEIKAIGYFRFKLSLEGIEPYFYIFAFSNNPDDKVEFVIIPCSELKKRFSSRKYITKNDYEIELRLWLMPDGYVFETTNFGAEGEYWFIGGRMADGTQWDYSEFLNNWNQLHLT